MPRQSVSASTRNWPEDIVHENGNYNCVDGVPKQKHVPDRDEWEDEKRE